jgi:hypothetical protein
MTAGEWLLLLFAAVILAGGLVLRMRELENELDAARELLARTRKERDYWLAECERMAWGGKEDTR